MSCRQLPGSHSQQAADGRNLLLMTHARQVRQQVGFYSVLSGIAMRATHAQG